MTSSSTLSIHLAPIHFQQTLVYAPSQNPPSQFSALIIVKRDRSAFRCTCQLACVTAALSVAQSICKLIENMKNAGISPAISEDCI